MITTKQLLNNIKEYLIVQLGDLSKSTPIIGFVKPLIDRILNNNLDKIESILGLIADKEGNIDVEQILNEMLDNVINTTPFKINTGFIGDIEIGGGNIKINIPLTDKKLVLNQNDLNILKETLISNK